MSNGVSMQKLGDVSPGTRSKGYSRDHIDPAPIVLWNGASPAAALYYQSESNSNARWMEQRIARLDGRKEGGFPIELKASLPREAPNADFLDIYEPSQLLPADVNGDGIDELVMLRRLGGVEVHGLKGPLFQHPAHLAGPDAHYKLSQYLTVPLDGRDVMLLLYERTPSTQTGPGDQSLLLRIDGRGISQIPLRELASRHVRTVGAIQRPKSADIDELLLLLSEGEDDSALARCRPDGTLIAPPRKMYVRPPDEFFFRFTPHSDRAVLESRASVMVLSPDRPVNWIRSIDVGAKLHGDSDPTILETVDVDADPKVLFEADGQLWAMNEEGTSFQPAGRGWSALPKFGPFRRLAPPPSPASSLRLKAAMEAGEGRTLAITSRKRETRPMTHQDWQNAADRFLPQAEAMELRKKLQPSLETADPYRDIRMKRERDRLNAPEVHSIEEWKRTLPKSYAEVAASNSKTYDIDVAFRFKELKEAPEQMARFPDPEGLRAFLAELEVGAQTTMTLIDGASIATFQVPGAVPELETFVRGTVVFRLRGATLSMVLALEATAPDGKDGPAFYLIQAPLGGGH